MHFVENKKEEGSREKKYSLFILNSIKVSKKAQGWEMLIQVYGKTVLLLKRFKFLIN